MFHKRKVCHISRWCVVGNFKGDKNTYKLLILFSFTFEQLSNSGVCPKNKEKKSKTRYATTKHKCAYRKLKFRRPIARYSISKRRHLPFRISFLRTPAPGTYRETNFFFLHFTFAPDDSSFTINEYSIFSFGYASDVRPYTSGTYNYSRPIPDPSVQYESGDFVHSTTYDPRPPSMDHLNPDNRLMGSVVTSGE